MHSEVYSLCMILYYVDQQFTARNLGVALSTVVEWRTLGANLGIPFDRLEQIQRDNYGKMSNKLVIMGV